VAGGEGLVGEVAAGRSVGAEDCDTHDVWSSFHMTLGTPLTVPITQRRLNADE
jgi:hypothetical protein